MFYLTLFFFNHPPTPEIYTFPYTTLSDLAPAVVHAAGVLPEDASADEHRAQGRRDLGDRDGPADRKSTRLNSSHMSISYAVFCLKKKNNFRNCFWFAKRSRRELFHCSRFV